MDFHKKSGNFLPLKFLEAPSELCTPRLLRRPFLTKSGLQSLKNTVGRHNQLPFFVHWDEPLNSEFPQRETNNPPLAVSGSRVEFHFAWFIGCGGMNDLDLIR